MTESAKSRVIGLKHIALEVGDVQEALAFYGKLFEFKLRGKSDSTKESARYPLTRTRTRAKND
jgi:catechol 2,3-dioxygenase-like lactoylglutathione lyase family enzyme